MAVVVKKTASFFENRMRVKQGYVDSALTEMRIFVVTIYLMVKSVPSRIIDSDGRSRNTIIYLLS